MDRERLQRILLGEFNLRRVMWSAVCIYVSVVVVAFLISDSMIFCPQSPSYEDGPEIRKIVTEDGERISALYLENADADYTILMSHGNAEDIGDARPFAEAFVRRGFSVLVYDYRGYGTSEGKPSTRKAYKDADAAYQYLVEKLHTPPEKIIVLGRSLGGALAIHTAYKNKVAGLIVENTFATAFRVRTTVPISPVDKMRNISKIAKIDCPSLIIHGEQDRVVPTWHGKALFKKAAEPKLHLWVKDASHNDLLSVAGDAYWNAIDQLVQLIRKQSE